MTGDKSKMVASGVDLLSRIGQIEVKHVVIAPYQLTPYDGYAHFIDKVKETIPREMVLHLQPGCDPETTVEQVLTPNFILNKLTLTQASARFISSGRSLVLTTEYTITTENVVGTRKSGSGFVMQVAGLLRPRLVSGEAVPVSIYISNNWIVDDGVVVGGRSVDQDADAVIACPFTVDADSVDASLFDDVFGSGIYEWTARDVHTMCSHLSDKCRASAYASIAGQVDSFAKTIPARLMECETAVEMGICWNRAKLRVSFIAMTFAPICRKQLDAFDAIFDTRMRNVWLENLEAFRSIAVNVISEYSDCRETRNVDRVEEVFRIVRESGVFREVFIPMFAESVKCYVRPIVDELRRKKVSEYLIEATKMKDQEQELAERLIDRYAMDDVVGAINDVVFTEKLDAICSGLKVLIDGEDATSVHLCVKYAVMTDTIKHFTRKLSYKIERAAENCFKADDVVRELLRVHSTLTRFCAKSFSQEHVKILRVAFDKGMNSSPDIAARLLAEEIHRRFRAGSQIPRTLLEEYMAIFLVLGSKEVFGVYHHLLLCQRVLLLNDRVNEADEMFLGMLREQYGPEYTKRCDAIFADVKKSIEYTTEFRAHGKLSITFNALVLHREVWPHAEMTVGNIAVASDANSVLTKFGVWFGEKRSNIKLQWSLDFTRVVMAVSGVVGIDKVECSAVHAIILLQFNDTDELELVDLAAKTEICEEQLERSLSVIASQKPSLLTRNGKNWEVNCCVATDDDIISLPLSFPSLPDVTGTPKAVTQQSRATQVDAVVVSVMKECRSMERTDLKRKVKDRLSFRLDENLYESRLAHLEKISYLKLDPSGRVHYIP